MRVTLFVDKGTGFGTFLYKNPPESGTGTKKHREVNIEWIPRMIDGVKTECALAFGELAIGIALLPSQCGLC